MRAVSFAKYDRGLARSVRWSSALTESCFNGSRVLLAFRMNPLYIQLGVQAHLDGDNGFTFGRLHGLEDARGAASLETYRDLRPELDRKKHRRAVSTGS